MLGRNLITSWRETAFYICLKQSFTPEQPSECFLNPGCGCAHPGKEVQCEDCPYLEACLSRCKRNPVAGNTSKTPRSIKN